MHVHIHTLIITNMTPVVEVFILQIIKLHQVVKTATSASRLIDSEVIDSDTHYEGKVLQLLRAVLADKTQSLSNELKAQTSVRKVSERLLSLETKTSRYHKSFPPTAIRLDNDHLILSV